MWCVHASAGGGVCVGRRGEQVYLGWQAWYEVDPVAAAEFDPERALQLRFMQVTGLDRRDQTIASLREAFV